MKTLDQIYRDIESEFHDPVRGWCQHYKIVEALAQERLQTQNLESQYAKGYNEVRIDNLTPAEAAQKLFEQEKRIKSLEMQITAKDQLHEALIAGLSRTFIDVITRLNSGEKVKP